VGKQGKLKAKAPVIHYGHNVKLAKKQKTGHLSEKQSGQVKAQSPKLVEYLTNPEKDRLSTRYTA
jgi:hypothetical protein